MSSASAPRTALFRADASPRIGSGHVMRSLTLADALRRRGVRSTFATGRTAGSLVDRIRTQGHAVLTLDVPDEAGARPWPTAVQEQDLGQVARAATAGFDLVVVDHYHLDATWERAARALTDLVVVLDDLSDRVRDADVLVDHNWYGAGTDRRYDGRVPDRCRQLLGPRYALLQPAYAAVRRTASPPAHPPQRVLVSFGGSDPTGETGKALEALAAPELAHLEVDVVLGSERVLTDRIAELVDARPGTRLHVGLPTLAHLLGDADLAIGASGTATWERICLGVPAIVATTGKDQSGVTRALAEAGLTLWAGLGAETTPARYAELLHHVAVGGTTTPPPLVDGRGAERVAEALAPADAVPDLAPATLEDLPLCIGADRCGPSGEPRVLDGPAAWAAGEERFRHALGDPGHRVLVVRLDGLPVGWVRQDGGPEPVIALDDAVGGRGLDRRVAELVHGRLEEDR